MSTSFEKVSELNIAFGNPKGDIANPNVNAIRKQAILCLEEAVEMVEAAYPGSKVSVTHDQRLMTSAGVDMVALMDAQGDLTTVNEGVAHIAGFNGDTVYDRVHASNMSKFIQNESQIEDALSYYWALGFPDGSLSIRGEFPQAAIIVAQDVVIEGKLYPTGKFLKNMLTFQEPNFWDLL